MARAEDAQFHPSALALARGCMDTPLGQHVTAVLCGAYVSDAHLHVTSKTQQQPPPLCARCGMEVSDAPHELWRCQGLSAQRTGDMPSSPFSARMGWPATPVTKQNRDYWRGIILSMAAVRAAVLADRHGTARADYE